MSSDIFVRFIDIIHNGVSIKVEVGCQSCAFGAWNDELEPCVTCYRTSSKEFPFSLWLFDPSYDTDDGETTPPSSGMLPQRQKIGHTTVAEGKNILRDYPQKVDVSIWSKLIVRFIIELKKLQEDDLIPEPSPCMADKELGEWLIKLQQYNRQRAFQMELQKEQQEQKQSTAQAPSQQPSQQEREVQSVVVADFITGYPSQIAQHYREYVCEINITDPYKARMLTAISNNELSKVSNAKEITLPTPSAELSTIKDALKQQGITGGRKR